jgi:hypothetical protein
METLMPRQPRGPYLSFNAKRGVYFIHWSRGQGKQGIRSTGTNHLPTAERKLTDFVTNEFRSIDAVGREAERERARRQQKVYFIGGEVGAIKIGIAVEPEKRLAELQSGSPIPLSILALAEGGREREWAYHTLLFHRHRLHGEWFERHPELMAEIDRINALAEASA